MSNRDEQAALARAMKLAQARRLCVAWAYWCIYGNLGQRGGRRPYLDTGGIEKRYRAPPQWHPPLPRMPEADENVGMAVQRAFIRLPKVYRLTLRAEFCVRPWLIAMDEAELAVATARRARVSIGAYQVTVNRALLALANVMKHMGTWRE